MSASLEKWEAGLPQEVDFWVRWLSGNTRWVEDRALRLSSGRPFPGWARDLIPDDRRRIRVLDVGSGPVTALGDSWAGREIAIVPVDPLAESYNEILDRYRITPPTRTVYGVGEKLVEQFGRESFDFAYACNCLDHALDPVECYRQMLEVLKPGCSLVTFHEANEAEYQKYEGLHQWNFDVENGRLMVWNPKSRRDLIEHCEHVADFQIEKERQYIRLRITRA